MALFNRFDPAAFLAARRHQGAPTAVPPFSAMETNGELPGEWLDGFTRLCRAASAQASFPSMRWNLITADMAVFIDRWAGKAAALGWTKLDLFGVGRDAPFHRLDLMGLVPSIGGKVVLAMTATTALLRCPDGTKQTYYRKPDQPGRVALWELE